MTFKCHSRSSGMTRFNRAPISVPYSNYGSISHRFRDTMRYWLKIANFWYPTFIWRPLGVTPSEFHSRVSVWKTRMMGLPGNKKSLTVNLAVSIQYTNVTDRRTHRRTPVNSKDRAICIASCGKNRRTRLLPA